MPNQNPPDKNKRIVKAMPDEFLQCRSMLHAWEITFWGSINRLPDHIDVPPIVRDFRWGWVRVLKLHPVRHSQRSVRSRQPDRPV